MLLLTHLMSVWENVSMIGQSNLHLTCFAVKQIIRGLFWCFIFLVNTLRGITSFIECPYSKFASSTSWCNITQFVSVLKDRGITCGKKCSLYFWSRFYPTSAAWHSQLFFCILSYVNSSCPFKKSYRNNLHCTYDRGVKAITETVSMLLFVGRGHR